MKSDIPNLSDDISSVYNTALEIARKGDLVAWRRIIKGWSNSTGQQVPSGSRNSNALARNPSTSKQ